MNKNEITTNKNNFVRRWKEYFCRWLCLIFGAIGVVIGGVVVRRYWKSREEQRLANEMRRELAASRKERRQRVRDTDLREDQRCIVCRIHPREIILLPCGHVCLCEDCSEHITNGCPICRKPIAQKQPAYIVWWTGSIVQIGYVDLYSRKFKKIRTIENKTKKHLL